MRQRPVNIARFFSLFLTALLLLVAVGGPSWVTARPSVPAAAGLQTKTDKTGKTTNNAHDAVVQAAQLEAVVTPALSFGFAQAVYLLPPPVLLILLDQPVQWRHFQIPHFYFSYFRHVFGHHIAINAP